MTKYIFNIALIFIAIFLYQQYQSAKIQHWENANYYIITSIVSFLLGVGLFVYDIAKKRKK